MRNKLSPRSKGLISVAFTLCPLFTLPPEQVLSQSSKQKETNQNFFSSALESFTVVMFGGDLMFSACCSSELFDWRYLMAGVQTLNCQLFTLGPHYAVTAGGDWCCGKCLFVAIREEKGSFFSTLWPMNLCTAAT